MSKIPVIAHCFALLAAFLVLTPNLSGQDPAQDAYEFDTDEEAYYIQFNEGEGTPLKDLIILCQDVTMYPIQFQEAEVEDQRIYIIGKQKIKKSRKGFFEYFQSVLISYEFICAPYGPEDDPFFITIRRMTPAARQGGMDLFRAQAPVVEMNEIAKYKDNPGMLITTTIQLKYIAARETMTSLNFYFQNQQLESIRPVENSNSLILTGFANKIYYITKLLKLMDVEPIEIESEFVKRELKYAVAEELEPVLTNLLAAARNLRPGQQAQPRAQGGLVEPEPKILAEPRTNSMLVTGSEKDLKKIQNWIDVLDVEVDPRGDIHVYRLKNTLAIEMQKVLEEMLRGQQQAGSSRRPPGSTGATTTTGIEAPAQVVADEASNSLVITASKTKYAELLEVIKRLDIRRKQVLIEAAVAELQSRVDSAFGIELAGLDLKTDADGNLITDNYTRPFGFTSFGLSTLIDENNDGFPDTRAPNVNTGFTGGIFNGQDFAIPFILYTLAREDNANILSMPSILTNDNEQATIEALDKEPTFSFNQGQNTDSTTFEDYQEAGITLTISPSISAGNYLKLQVKITISDFDETSDLSPPPATERLVETSVTIPDGHTMVIGGIIQKDRTEVESKVPFLGDLPLLGWLFRTQGGAERKTNLYIFITPHIIGDDFANLDDISYRKKKEVQALEGDILLIDPDFEYTNAEAQMIDAGANWIFEIPSYAEPDTGETTSAYIEPEAVENEDAYKTGEL
jgi:general secretion pathway protein D